MASENRQLPVSNKKRNPALTNAAARYNELLAQGTDYLSTDTSTKLTTNTPIYNTAFNLVATKKGIKMNKVAVSGASLEKLKRVNSRFIQVFALAVEDEEFPVSDFAFYQLDSKGNVRTMDSEEQIQAVAANLIAGEIARVGAGGAAMTNPAIAKVIARNNQFLLDESAERVADDAFVAAERALEALNDSADDTILFVYNEVETHFSNLAKSSQRVEGRKWGINYARVGSSKIVSGTVTDIDTNLPIESVEVYFENGNNTDETNVRGEYSLSTTLMDAQKLNAEHPLYAIFNVTVTLVEGSNLTVDIKMRKLP